MNFCDGVDAEIFPGLENTEELFCSAKELFLKQKLDFKIEHVRGTISKFKAIISSKISCVRELEEFIASYNEDNNETLRIAKRKPLTNRSSYNIVWYYRCQHKTRNPSTRNVQEI